MVFLRKFEFLAAAFAAILLVSTPVYSQQSPNNGVKQKLDDALKDQSKTKVPFKVLTLDQLFVQLKQEKEPAKAKRIARKIWFRWAQSGSETVDLLMTWATIAMKEKDWPRAFDLLDQVVVLAPQYAEGWNRRATAYFLRSKYGRSIHDIEQVLKLESRHFGALAGLGNILQRLGKSAENDQRALEIWKKVRDIYPANESAGKAIGLLEEKLSGKGI